MRMTTNQPSVIDSEGFSVRRTISISAPIEKVWAAITEAEHLAKWFPQAVELEPVTVGSTGVFTFDGFGGLPVRVEELDPPRMIAYRWGNDLGTPIVPLDEAKSTVFRFTLEPVDGGTTLTLVESGFNTLPDPAKSLEDNRGGWDHELDELVAYLESGS